MTLPFDAAAAAKCSFDLLGFWEVETMRRDAVGLLKLFSDENVSNHWRIFFFQQTV